MSLTLDDILEMYLRYVPEMSRHENAVDYAESWWPAHELGHLLTVSPRQIGQPGFGLDTDEMLGRRAELSYAYELAAMSVSRRLLTACGRCDLFKMEIEGTGEEVFDYGNRSRARQILRRRGVLRLPRDRARLEARVRRAVGLEAP